MINNAKLEFNATERAAALPGSYSSGPEAFLDVVFGVDGWTPEGRFPFDTEDPLFGFGHGLTYKFRPCVKLFRP